MTELIINTETGRIVGYTSVNYASNRTDRESVKTTESELSAVFDEADVDELAGTGEPIEVAIDDPLAYRDYLILVDGEIVFDDGYEREVDEDTE